MVVTWKVRFAAVALVALSLPWILGSFVTAYVAVAQPEEGRLAEGGVLVVMLSHDPDDLLAPPDAINVTVDDGAGQTCALTTTCRFELAAPKGTVTLHLPDGDASRPFYAPGRTQAMWSHDMDDEAATGTLGVTPRDAVGPLVLAAALLVAVVGGVRLWRGTGWRLPVMGAVALALASLLAAAFGMLLVAAFIVGVVFLERERLDGTAPWPTLQGYAQDVRAGLDEEE